MTSIYAVLQTLLPFEWAGHHFMLNAFLAILLVTPLFGVLLGSVAPLLSLVLFSVAFAVFITYIQNKSTASTDTIIGVFSSTAIALGLMMMSYGGGFNKFSSYLIGDILSVTPDDIGALAIIFLLVLATWGVLFNRLLVLSINASFARSRGIPSFWIQSAFAALLAIIVSISIQWVGILIINALLVLPAAAARNVAQNVKQYHAVSILAALVSGSTGLLLAYYFNMAVGATIVVVSAGVFFVTLALKPYFVR